MGKASHTHEFRNLRAGAGTIQGNSIIINGLTDVGTNHRIVWKNVPTTIGIQGGKTIRISVADIATNHHFAGQPVFGLVTSSYRVPMFQALIWKCYQAVKSRL
jgi:hypothetical protein